MRVESSAMASFRQQQQGLNFNAPLLSVRTRRSQHSAKPLKISTELSRETLREAGAVPFQWEQSPGRPKQNATSMDAASDTHVHSSNLSSSPSPSLSLSSPSSPTSSSSTSEKQQSRHCGVSVNPVANHEHDDVASPSNNVLSLEELPPVAYTNSGRLITWENQARAKTIGASFRSHGDSNRWQRHSHVHSSKRSASIILDTCKTASLKMIKNAVARVCRKAGASSLRTVSKVKRKATPSRFLSQAMAAVHRNKQQDNTTATASDDEEAAAVREVKAILQERLSQKAERRAASNTSAASVNANNPKDRSRSPQCSSRQINPLDEQNHFKENPNWFQSSHDNGAKHDQKSSSTSMKSSNLSKRIGKTLWVDTKAMDSVKEVLLQNRKSVQTRDQSEKSEGSFTRLLKQSSTKKSSLSIVPPVFPPKCQKNRLTVGSHNETGITALSNCKSSSTNTTDIGWPLGISGYPPAKSASSVSENPRSTIKALPAPGEDDNAVTEVPLPPLPPSPAGGSWLRKALSSQSKHKSGFGNINPLEKQDVCSPASVRRKRWEDMVRGSPRHVKRCSEVRKIADERRLAHVTKNHNCSFF